MGSLAFLTQEEGHGMPTRIVTDSACDLPESVAGAYGIVVLPCFINIGDQSYLDGVELSRRRFYEELPHYKSRPTTAAPGIGVFERAYRQLADEGADEVVSVHVSGLLSNTVNVARLTAASSVGVAVYVFDTGQLTLGTGFLALAAARAANKGKSAHEILALLQGMAARVFAFAALDTLEYLRRSGRLSWLQSGFGNLLKVKPIVTIHGGEIRLERVRTNAKAMRRLVSLTGDLGSLAQLAVVHAAAQEKAMELLHRLGPIIPSDESPLCVEVTPVIGTHVGPGSVGLVCVAREKR